MSLPERYVNEAIAEIRQANDPDLWEEVAGKLADVLVVYRRALCQPVIRFTEQRQRMIDDMAFDAAVVTVFGDESIHDVTD